MPPTFPDEVLRIFWDVDARAVDPEKHRDYILERVMTRGDWVSMRWLRATYSASELADFLRRKGDRLAPRELAYWALMASVDVSPPRGGGRPSWAGDGRL